MASEQKAPEDFYFNTSDDEAVYDASDSTTMDDSYLAHLSERMEKSSSPPGAPPPPGVPPPPEVGEKPDKGNLPQSFAPAFSDDSQDNPLRVEPMAIPTPPRSDPMGAPKKGPSENNNDVIKLGDDAVEPESPFQGSSQPPAPSQKPSAPPHPSQPAISTGPSDLLKTVPPPPEDLEPYDPELDPATYDAPTFVRPSLVDQDPVPVIEILQGNESGRSYRFEKDVVTIGRSLDNDVVVTDIAVSRRHTKLTRQGNNVFVEDMGSGNGTVVNGVKVPRSPIGSADRMEVGNTIFRIVFPGAESFPENAAPLGPQAHPPAGPLHQKSTMYLNDGNQVLQQIGIPPGQQVVVPTAAGPIVAVSPSPIPLPPNHEATPHFQNLSSPMGMSVQVEQHHALQRSSPRSFKLAMAVLAVVMLFIGSLAIVAAMIHLNNRSSGSGTGPGEVTAEGLFDTGTKAYVERRWGQAADSFEQVLALDQANAKARDYLNKARAEERNQGTLEAARQAITEENFDAAITTLSSIPRSSVYSTEAVDIGTEAKTLYSKRLTKEAERLAENDPELAIERVDRALKLLPTNTAAREIRQNLSKGGEPEPEQETPSETAVAVAPTPSSKGSGSRRPTHTTQSKRNNQAGNQRKSSSSGTSSKAISSILSQYKHGNFSGAISRAKELTASGSESDRQKARSLERQITRFQKAWSGAKSSGNPRQKMNHLEQALRLDRQISGGHFSPQIRPMLREEYVSNAQRAWRAGQYASACQSAMRALKLDRGAAGAASLMQKCESKARTFYSQGEKLRRSDLSKAKGYWRKVLNMVPRTNPYYAKAYSAVNNAGRGRFQDEDE